MNFVLTWPWIQFSAGSTVVVIDQAWHCALKPAGNVWRKKRTKEKKEVAGEISKIRTSCRNWGWRSFAKNRVRCACILGAVYCICQSYTVYLWIVFQLKWNWKCTVYVSMLRLTVLLYLVAQVFHWHLTLSASTVNKHKPWIETSYHGVITENTDIVLLDPPLVALDKDAPIPYAGMVHCSPNGCQLENDHSNMGKGGLPQSKWEQLMMMEVLIRTGTHSCRMYLH